MVYIQRREDEILTFKNKNFSFLGLAKKKKNV